jgi:hypothetical protein
MLTLIFLFLPIGYVCYWPMLFSHGKIGLRYFGWSDYNSLLKLAWILFCAIFIILTIASIALHDRPFSENLIVPSIQAGYTIAHLHFLSIPKSSWDNRKYPVRFH